MNSIGFALCLVDMVSMQEGIEQINITERLAQLLIVARLVNTYEPSTA